jgi:anti-sigma B factor antagonist
MRHGLTISTSQLDGVEVVALTGYLDGHTYGDVEKLLTEKLKAGVKLIVIDLAAISYIASAGVGSMISAQHKFSSSGGRIEIARPSPNVHEIFSILGLDALFTIHTDLASATRAAKG